MKTARYYQIKRSNEANAFINIHSGEEIHHEYYYVQIRYWTKTCTLRYCSERTGWGWKKMSGYYKKNLAVVQKRGTEITRDFIDLVRTFEE